MEDAEHSGSDDEAAGDRHAGLSERLRNDALEASALMPSSALIMRSCDGHPGRGCLCFTRLPVAGSAFPLLSKWRDGGGARKGREGQSERKKAQAVAN